ncbi:glutathione S-transferase family protein [Sphingobium sp. JS3065]|uniref:glutathione S-transferase family protein n=1 Tax=Sphingobium sp. JS3065 TaxID=2970925 RepID=UPI002264472A|nr:glutathione S-transferase family protein [Sphingobium sp. JS3065]UZW56935.1 glutathione S-transferase family protein [Sphingobium sp. JS3065]
MYDREGGPHPARVRIVLAEKGLEDQVEFVSVDLMAAEQKQGAFLGMNPIGKIPVLVLDDGTIISESTAITMYLDNLDGHPTLTGVSPREKGLIHMMQRRAEMMLIDAVEDYFHYGTRGLGPALRPWRMPDWEGAREWGKRRGDYAVKNMAYFNELLSRQPFLAVDSFSMADLPLYCGLYFADLVGVPIADDHTALLEWRTKVAEIPSVKFHGGQQFRPEDAARRPG